MILLSSLTNLSWKARVFSRSFTNILPYRTGSLSITSPSEMTFWKILNHTERHKTFKKGAELLNCWQSELRARRNYLEHLTKTSKDPILYRSKKKILAWTLSQMLHLDKASKWTYLMPKEVPRMKWAAITIHQSKTEQIEGNNLKGVIKSGTVKWKTLRRRSPLTLLFSSLITTLRDLKATSCKKEGNSIFTI